MADNAERAAKAARAKAMVSPYVTLPYVSSNFGF